MTPRQQIRHCSKLSAATASVVEAGGPQAPQSVPGRPPAKVVGVVRPPGMEQIVIERGKGGAAGETIELTTRDGRLLDVTIPAAAKPRQKIMVDVPPPTASVGAAAAARGSVSAVGKRSRSFQAPLFEQGQRVEGNWGAHGIWCVGGRFVSEWVAALNQTTRRTERHSTE